MKTVQPRGTEDEVDSPLEPGEDPDPLSARIGLGAMGQVAGEAEGESPSSSENTPGQMAAARAERKHDPYRIRGDALRRSLHITMIAWLPGAFWAGATSGAPAVELAKYLGASAFVYSLMIAAPMLTVLLQIPGSVMVEWIGARKKFFVWTVTPHRTLYVVLGILPWVTPRGVTWPAMLMVGVLLLSMGLNNFGGQAWTNWMADLVPPRVRGKYFAARSRMGVAMLCVSGLAVAWVLDLCKQPWFNDMMGPVSRWAGMPPLMFLVSMVFIVSGLVGMLDILSFSKVSEPPMRAVSSEALWLRLAEPLKDSGFRRFVAYWSVWTAANSFCGWMWWLYLLDFFEAEKVRGSTAWYTTHPFLAGTLILGFGFQAGQFLGYPIWGRAVDRFGCKPVFFISSVVHTSGWLWWIFLSPVMLPWLFVTQMLGGFMFGGADIASFNMMLQFNRRGGPGYQAVGSVIFSVVGAAAMLAGGALATYLKDVTFLIGEGTRYEHTFNRYAVLIVIGVAIKYLGDLVFLPAVRDVEGKSRIHALRFVFDNTYGTLNTLIFTPLRTGAGMAGRGLDGVREAVVDAASGVADVASDVADVASEGIKKIWK